MIASHTYQTRSVAVQGGDLFAGVWEPTQDVTGTIIAIHGVTASHRAWREVVPTLAGVRIIAPDLRGRGRSNGVTGAAGMAAHAADIIALMDSMGIEKTMLVGHSMGGFVAVVTAYLHPERISRVALIDGGLPLDVPPGLTPEALVSHILGPTAARLEMRFADDEGYFDFWRAHPAFVNDWTPALEDYLSYDLVPAEDGMLRPSTSYAVMVDDTVDLNTGSLLREAIAGLAIPAVFAWVPRGLQNEVPGLYAPEHVEKLSAEYPDVRVLFIDDLNHYTVVMSPQGASAIGSLITAELASSLVQ